MTYQAELDYMMGVLRKMNLQVLLMTPENRHLQRPDLGLRRFLGIEELYERTVQLIPAILKPNAINKITDEFLCNYIFLHLPEMRETSLIIGPYFSFQLPKERLLEEAERHGVSARRFSRFEDCFSSIPVLTDDTALFALLSTFGETVWGKGSAFEFVDFTLELPTFSANPMPDSNDMDPESLALQMQAMEKRYAYENELMEHVSQGLASRAELMLRNLPTNLMGQRASDPVRSIKNYCIVCNTLLRKAAEKGGVHPLQLDLHSTALAKQAEMVNQPEEGIEVMREMVRTYCRLVRKHSIGHLPPLVQRTLTHIDANLAGDLSLGVLAAIHNVSENYLSTLFHREVGKTITECILEKRMEMAANLLLTTHLQIQTVAQHCGYSDVNYFSKVFKKTLGVTPKQFRQRRNSPLGL